MDTRRLTDELEKLCADTYVKTRVFRIADVRELVAYCKSLRAEAAELARALQSLRTCSAVRQSKMCGQCDGKADELLSRPTVVELRKEKD